MIQLTCCFNDSVNNINIETKQIDSNFQIALSYIMWVNNTLQQLKAQVIKAKSYKLKHRDAKQIQPYLVVFDKCFASTDHAASFDKVVEYFIQVFVCCINVMPNDKLYDCFKKLISWLNQNKIKNKAYCLIKQVVEICEKQFPYNKLTDKNLAGKSKQKDEKKKNKEKQRESSKQRDFSSQRDFRQKKQQNTSIQSTKQNLKAVLSLVRKSGQKNMLEQDVYSVFVDYYLYRLDEQIKSIKSKGKKGNDMQDVKSENKQIKLGSHILSQLSTMLANRNKPNVGPTIQKHIPNSTNNYICLYLLIQSKNIPQLLLGERNGQNMNVHRNVQLGRVKHHIQIENAYVNFTNAMGYDSSSVTADEQIVALVVEQVLQLLARLLRDQQWAQIEHIYHLFINGSVGELQNSEQLLNRLYIHASQGIWIKDPDMRDRYKASNWAKWSKVFIDAHTEYIEATKLSHALLNSKQGKGNTMSISYVIKLCVMASLLLNPPLLLHEESKQLDSAITSIIGRLLEEIKTPRNHSMLDELQEGDNMRKLVYDEYWSLYCDCLTMLHAHCLAAYQQSKPPQTDIQGRLAIHRQQQSRWRQLLQQLATESQQNRQVALQSIKKLLSGEKKSNQTSIFQNWRVAMEVLFDLTLLQLRQNNQKDKNTQQMQQLYSNQAINAMAALNLNPPLLAKIQFENKSQLLYISSIDSTCVQVLYLIAQGVDRDELVSHIKKLMSQAFDRVDQSAIRNHIIHNLFLSKCLLMTNHPVKCKILMEELTRHHQAQALRNREAGVQKYLQALLTGVPKILLIQYSKYIATKDKLQMRHLIFEKQVLNLQYLLDADLFDLVSKVQTKATST